MEHRDGEKRAICLDSFDRGEMKIGILCIIISLFMPLLFNVESFSILRTYDRALRMAEKTDLAAAAIKLVVLNAIRAVPHYVGAFFVGESLSFRWKQRRAWLINSLMILVLLKLAYWGIGAIYDIHYDFGIPAMLVCFFVLLFRKIHYRYISLAKKAIMIILILIAFQFLDIMPFMNPFPVGRGETSMEIKMAAVILDAETVLNTVGMVGMILFLAFALVVFFQLKDENTLKELNVLKEQNQAILMQSQINEMKNRTYQEMQYLVHDLKSPLTTVQTLVGVLKMESEAEDRKQDTGYLNYIEDAVDRMSIMISDILYQDQQTLHTTRELVGVVLAQSSVNDYAAYLHMDNQAPDAQIHANRFLFPRALINLIENSAQAMDGQDDPEIWLRVDRESEKEIVFTVEDNGAGIGEQQLNGIWNRGTSGRASSGLGLAFVKHVVEQMNGRIRMDSAVGKGTRICLIFSEDTEEVC